jgi:hypothetical protein
VSLEDIIIGVYLKVSEYFRKIVPEEGLRQSGPAPALSDDEVLSMEIAGEYFGLGSDKGIWEYFVTHWGNWFPKLGCGRSFTRQLANLVHVRHSAPPPRSGRITRQLANLVHVKQAMLQRIAADNTADKDLYLFDGFPIPVCHIKRYRRSRNDLKADGAVGYCAAKDEKHFGFKGHLVITQDGAVKGFDMAAANIDERDVLPELTQGLTGDLIADKGSIRPELKEELKNRGLQLHTPLRSNMKDTRPKRLVNICQNIRRTVETVIGQCVDRFQIQLIKAKDLWHLQAKVLRKILAHAVIFSVNAEQNPENPLQFEKLPSC